MSQFLCLLLLLLDPLSSHPCHLIAAPFPGLSVEVTCSAVSWLHIVLGSLPGTPITPYIFPLLRLITWSCLCILLYPSLDYPVQFILSVMSDSLWPHGLQHARPPCPSPTPRAYSNSCPSGHWCHPTISSSVVPFSSHLQSFPPSESFQMSQLFTSGGWSIGVSASASVLPMNIQDSFPLGWTGWISLQSKGLSRVFSNTTVQKHKFFGPQHSL